MRLGTLANGEPINVGAYFLAGNAGQKLNIGTMASWDIPGSNPPLNGLVAAHAKLLSCGNRSAEKSYGLGDRFVFVHESHFIQEKLATQGENKEKLVVTRKGRLSQRRAWKASLAPIACGKSAICAFEARKASTRSTGNVAAVIGVVGVIAALMGVRNRFILQTP